VLNSPQLNARISRLRTNPRRRRYHVGRRNCPRRLDWPSHSSNTQIRLCRRRLRGVGNGWQTAPNIYSGRGVRRIAGRSTQPSKCEHYSTSEGHRLPGSSQGDPASDNRAIGRQALFGLKAIGVRAACEILDFCTDAIGALRRIRRFFKKGCRVRAVENFTSDRRRC